MSNDKFNVKSSCFLRITGHLLIVKALIKNGADLNATNSFGTSVLKWAAIRKKADAIEVLLRAGADSNRKDISGFNAFFAAARSGLTCSFYSEQN